MTLQTLIDALTTIEANRIQNDKETGVKVEIANGRMIGLTLDIERIEDEGDRIVITTE